MQQEKSRPYLRIAGKIFLLLLTLYPPVYLAVIILSLITGHLPQTTGDISDPGARTLLLAHLTAMFLLLVTFAIYLYSVVTNTSIDSNAKVIWAVVLLQFNMLAMPVYWYRHIWRRREPLPEELRPQALRW